MKKTTEQPTPKNAIPRNSDKLKDRLRAALDVLELKGLDKSDAKRRVIEKEPAWQQYLAYQKLNSILIFRSSDEDVTKIIEEYAAELTVNKAEVATSKQKQ